MSIETWDGSLELEFPVHHTPRILRTPSIRHILSCTSGSYPFRFVDFLFAILLYFLQYYYLYLIFLHSDISVTKARVTAWLFVMEHHSEKTYSLRVQSNIIVLQTLSPHETNANIIISLPIEPNPTATTCQVVCIKFFPRLSHNLVMHNPLHSLYTWLEYVSIKGKKYSGKSELLRQILYTIETLRWSRSINKFYSLILVPCTRG